MTFDNNSAERIAELEEDNRRLRRLLDQRDAPGELRHRLHNTLALLRAVIHKSADTERDPSSYVAHLEDRLDAIARAQAVADQHGEMDLRTLLADEFLRYGTLEGERAVLVGPKVQLQPRAGQVLALAIHELAVNAVEHGVLGTEHGRVDVAWEVVGTGRDHFMTFTWMENGPSSLTGFTRQGFGTEVLTRMLAHSLKATTEIGINAGRLRCVIRLPLSKQVGRLVTD